MAMWMDQPRCITCPKAFMPEGAALQPEGLLQCRKDQPKLFLVDARMVGGTQMGAAFITRFPEVQKKEWCADHPDFVAWLAKKEPHHG